MRDDTQRLTRIWTAHTDSHDAVALTAEARAPQMSPSSVRAENVARLQGRWIGVTPHHNASRRYTPTSGVKA